MFGSRWGARLLAFLAAVGIGIAVGAVDVHADQGPAPHAKVGGGWWEVEDERWFDFTITATKTIPAGKSWTFTVDTVADGPIDVAVDAPRLVMTSATANSFTVVTKSAIHEGTVVHLRPLRIALDANLVATGVFEGYGGTFVVKLGDKSLRMGF
jgi:hypothetical protein